MPGTNDELRILAATRLRMARAAARMNQTEAAAAAQVHLSRLSPDDRMSREIIRKYEDEKVPYHSLGSKPARAIALAEALNVDPTWLAPDLPLSPEGVTTLKRVLADLVDVWPKPNLPAKAAAAKRAAKKKGK